MTPVLAKLHWLPVHYHIQFKIAVITFKALTMQQPHYLSELIQIHVPHRHHLRSADAERLAVPRTKLKFTNRAFSHAAPTIWNGLAVCRSALSIAVTHSQFKRLVKSELYNRAFDNI